MLNLLLASASSALVSVTMRLSEGKTRNTIAMLMVNYLLCVAWVFTGAKDNGNATRVGFLTTSVMGLLFNELLMLLFRLMLGESQILFTIFGFSVSMYMVNKALATLLVMVWNYFTKRAMLRRNS